MLIWSVWSRCVLFGFDLYRLFFICTVRCRCVLFGFDLYCSTLTCSIRVLIGTVRCRCVLFGFDQYCCSFICLNHVLIGIVQCQCVLLGIDLYCSTLISSIWFWSVLFDTDMFYPFFICSFRSVSSDVFLFWSFLIGVAQRRWILIVAHLRTCAYDRTTCNS